MLPISLHSSSQEVPHLHLWDHLNLDLIVHITISIFVKAIQQISRKFKTFSHFTVFSWALQTVPTFASYPVLKLLSHFLVSFQQYSLYWYQFTVLVYFHTADKVIPENGQFIKEESLIGLTVSCGWGSLTIMAAGECRPKSHLIWWQERECMQGNPPL